MGHGGIDNASRAPGALREPGTALIFHVEAGRNPGAVARRRLDLLVDDVDRATLARLRVLVFALVNRSARVRRRAPVLVSVTVRADAVHAVVGDDPPGEPRVLDWALLLVDRMADRWAVERGVWFDLDRGPSGASA